MPNPSAKYDANGGSVVNIILAKNKLFGTNYVFTNGIGSGQNLRGTIGLDINHREKNINLFGSYNFAHNQQYFKSYSTRFLNNSIIKTDEYEVRKRSNHAYKLGVDCDLNSHSSFGTLITGSLNYRDREVSNSSELNYAGQISDSSAKVSANGKSIINNPSVNLYYKNILDTTGTELTMNVDYMTYKKKWNDAFTNEYFDSHGIQYKKPNFLKDNSPAGISVYSFSADLVKPTKNARWETGLKTNYTVTDNDIFWQYKYDSGWVTDTGKTNHFVCRENINSAYLNYIQLIKKWNLQAGLRIEQTNTEGKSITLNQINRNSYLDFFPNISVGYTKDYNSVISFSYRKSINRFGFNIVNPFIIYQNQYAYSQGNPNIKPEIYQSAELSYTYKQAYSFSIDYTHGIKTLGEIFLPGANNVTISSYANYNSSDILYFSLSANRNVTEYWRVSFNPMYGYISLKNGVENFSTGSAKNLWVGELEWSNSFTLKKGWSGEFSLMYIRPFQYGSYTTHTIFSTDLGISKSAMKNKINIKLGISDFFNTLNYNKELNYAGIVTSLKYKPETRFINLLIKYKFGNGNVKVKYQKQSKISDLKNRIN